MGMNGQQQEVRKTGWRRWGVTLALAGVFGVVYPLVRAIPTPQCGILHTTNLRESGDGLEFCGPASAVFVDLQTTRFPVRARWEVEGSAQVGEEFAYALRLETSAGRQLGDGDLAVVHTRKVHVLVVDPRLEDYQHLHPEWDGRGAWRGRFTPRRSGNYRIYVEVVPLATAAPVLAAVALRVEGAAGEPVAEGVVSGRAVQAVQVGTHKVALSFLTGTPRAGQEAELRLDVMDPAGTGARVPLEPIMGAWAHLVAFDAGGRGVAHLHPLDEGSGFEDGAPSFGFGFRTDLPGRYRFWAQIILAGEERMVPFDVEVAAANE